jgi:hypothetical protein
MTSSTSLAGSRRSVTCRLHVYPGSTIVNLIVKSMRPCQSLNVATSIAVSPNLMDGIGDRREGVDDARHVGIVRCWES